MKLHHIVLIYTQVVGFFLVSVSVFMDQFIDDPSVLINFLRIPVYILVASLLFIIVYFVVVDIIIRFVFTRRGYQRIRDDFSTELNL